MASLFARRNKKSDSSSKLVSGPSALAPRVPHHQTTSPMQPSSPSTPLYERFARTGPAAPGPSQYGGGARTRTESAVSANTNSRALQSNRASRADDVGLEGGYVNVNLNVAKSPGRPANGLPSSNSPAKSQRSLPRSVMEKPLPAPVPGPSSGVWEVESNRLESTVSRCYCAYSSITSPSFVRPLFLSLLVSLRVCAEFERLFTEAAKKIPNLATVLCIFTEPRINN